LKLAASCGFRVRFHSLVNGAAAPPQSSCVPTGTGRTNQLMLFALTSQFAAQ